MLLSDADISWMKSTQQLAMPGTVVIERYTGIDDGMGGRIETWAAVGTCIGRIYTEKRRGNFEQTGGAQTLSMSHWVATLPVGTDVTAKDRLYYDSKSWEVSEVNSGEMWKTAVRCELVITNEERRT